MIEYLKPIFEGRLETLLEKENIRFESTLEALLKDKTIPEEEKIDLVISELDKRIPDNERCGCVLEIKVGLGGLESYYFNHTLMTEYLKIFKMLNIKHEIFDLLYPEENYNEYKGIRFVRINIESPVYFLLKFEHGKHRLIEISPFTKKRQTTISFIEVFPIYEESEIKLNEKDLKIESMKATGKGGQYVNKTESAVRVTHIPTGITITCQSERSQYQNKKLALNLLKSKLMELNKEKERNEIKELRKNIIYNKFSNYIRTYYYDEDKVVDIQLDKFVTPLKNALLNIFGYKLLKVYLEEQAEVVKK
ncbi:MAG: peptide chain release factor-like protein [Thermoplasmata archaeon]